MKLIYTAIFTPLEQQPGYCVTVPDMPGLVTQGSSLAEAIEMATDAACGWALDELEEGRAIPSGADGMQSLNLEDHQFTSLLTLDMDSYNEKYGNKAIRKNCTIPTWLNTLAESSNINFSSVLQKALIRELHIGQ